MATNCRQCAAGLAHCHGTLIQHSGGRPECTDQHCTQPESILHALVVDCDALGCPCGQPIGSTGPSLTAPRAG